MRSLEPADYGFVANVLGSRARKARTRGHRGLLMLVFIAIVILVGTQSTRVLLDADTEADEDQTVSVVPSNRYEFKVYALNQSRAAQRDTLTQFSFNSGDLPIGITSIDLGDFRKDAAFQNTYYGCSGILMNASGSTASITLRESSGKFIGTVVYQGQDPVVFGSSAWSSSDSNAKTFDGTDILVIDWRAGSWTPESGVIVEHPRNVTVSQARFFVMVFAPGYDQEIPEFDMLFASVLLVGIVLMIKRRRFPGARKGIAP